MLLGFFLFIATQAISMPIGSYSEASPAKNDFCFKDELCDMVEDA